MGFPIFILYFRIFISFFRLSAEMLAREAARDPRVMSILFRHFDEDGDGVLTENELNL